MEPVSIPAQRGTLEDPEVLQNVPGHVIPILRGSTTTSRPRRRSSSRARHARRRVHQVPPEAGRLRPAPAGRADDPREAAVRRDHAGADGEVRGRGREVRAAEQGPHHDAPEHPDAPHPAARRREGDPRARRGGAVEPRGLRQHDAQRDRRPVGGRRQGRAVRPDALRGSVRALLRAPPDHAGDAAQGQDRLRRLVRRPRDLRHPRHRLPRARQADRGPRRGARRADAGRRRHLDHAAHGPGPVRLRRARQRRLPARSPRR